MESFLCKPRLNLWAGSEPFVPEAFKWFPQLTVTTFKQRVHGWHQKVRGLFLEINEEQQMKSYPQAWVNIGQIHNLKFLFRTRYDSHCLYLDLHPHPPLPLQETVSVSVNKMALCYTFWVQLSFFSFLARWINGWEENQSSQPGIFPFGGFHFLEILDNSQIMCFNVLSPRVYLGR